MKSASFPLAALTLAGCAALLLADAGCITHVSMTKVLPGQNPRGLRVHLPAPFIVGRPTPAGGITYEVVYLPDPDEEYAIDAWTLLAKQKVVLNRTRDLFLSKAELTQDSTAIAKAVSDTAGQVGGAAVDSYAKQQAATQASKAKAAEDSVAPAARAPAAPDDVAVKTDDLGKKLAVLVDATKNAGAAQETLRNATEAAAKGGGNGELVPLAQAMKTNADAALASAENDVKAAKGALAQSQAAAAHTPPPPARPPARSRPPVKVPGPVLYKIVEDSRTGGIRLEEVSWCLFSMNGRPAGSGTQLTYETSGKQAAAPAPDANRKAPKATAKTTGGPGQPRTTVVSFDPRTKIKELDLNQSAFLSGTGSAAKRAAVTTLAEVQKADDYTVSIKWKDRDVAPAGDYVAELRITFEGGASVAVLAKTPLGP